MKKRSGKQFRSAGLAGLRRMTAGLVHHRAPVWSPDGRWLCIEVGEGADSSWLVCDHKGRPARVLAGPAEGGASFHPDGSLAYGRRVGATLEIWQLDAGGRGPHLLLGRDGWFYRDPAYSPDGRFLCYAAEEAAQDDQQSRMQLYLLHLQSGARTHLIEGGLGQLGRPAWAPEGDSIYCEAALGDDVAVYHLPQGPLLSWLETPQGPGRERARRPHGGPRRLTPPGVRCRRPAPFGQGLLVIEREHADGQCDLALLDHTGDQGDELHLPGSGPLSGAQPGDLPQVREKRLTQRVRAAREPAVVVRKGVAQVACAMLNVAHDGEVQRYDVYLGHLTGLTGLARGAADGAAGTDP